MKCADCGRTMGFGHYCPARAKAARAGAVVDARNQESAPRREAFVRVANISIGCDCGDESHTDYEVCVGDVAVNEFPDVDSAYMLATRLDAAIAAHVAAAVRVEREAAVKFLAEWSVDLHGEMLTTRADAVRLASLALAEGEHLAEGRGEGGDGG